MTADTAIVELSAIDTHPLRRTVLRAGTATSDVGFEGDDDPGTLHLGVQVGGELVAVSTWIRRRHPDHPALDGVQLRGMATAEVARGAGHASRLLATAEARLAADGVELLWARARDTAVGFYVAHGFRTFGRGYVDLATGLPHHDVVKRLP